MVELRASTTDRRRPPMTDTSMTLIDLLQKHDEGDFLLAVTEAVL